MEFADALRRRRMVRHFTGDPVPPEQAERIARSVVRAPTAGNAQGITVISTTDPVTIHRIAEACGEREYVERGFDPWLSSAGQMIALCAEPGRYRARYSESDKDLSSLEPIPWWWVDAGAALMALLLSVVAEGLAAGFHGGHRATGVHQILGIPEEVVLVGVVAVGHAAPDRRSGSLDRPRRGDAVRLDRW